MLNTNSAALMTVDLWRLKLAGRMLNTAGIAFLAGASAILACAYLSAVERTGVGLLFSAAMIFLGELLTRRGTQSWWVGTSMIGTGYALGAFFAHATYYLAGLAGLDNAYPCWLLELTLGGLAAWHGSRNNLLCWAAVPFTFWCTGSVLMHALPSTDTLSLSGFTFKVSAAANVVGMLWLAGLSALYKQLEVSPEKGLTKLMYRSAHEVCFVLTAISALAMPKFCSQLQYAPLWWAVEMPVLLAICWRSSSFLKHTLIMAIWVLSAVLSQSSGFMLSPVVTMAVPVSGLVMAFSYRYLKSSWAHWQKVMGYAVYMFGSVGLALAIPFLHLGVTEAMPYFLLEAAALIALALVLRDRLLQTVASMTAAASLALFGAHWQQWSLPLTGMVAAGCYSASLVYGYVKGKGGWEKSDFSPLPGAQTLSAREAGWLEMGTAAAGYVTLMVGSFLLFANPNNTIAWGIEAFSLIAFGFMTQKMGHRASGLLALGMACAKLSIYDLSGAGTLMRRLVSFGSVGVCCIAASIFYLVEYEWKKKPSQPSVPTDSQAEQNKPEK